MRQGCISLGKVQCDSCHTTIPYAERYLVVDEEDGAEVDHGQRRRYCAACSLDRGYAEYREEKGEGVLTFFPGEEVRPPAEDSGPGEQNE